MPEDLLKKYKEELCSNCKSKCEKGIVVFTETVTTGNEVKQILCAKCVDYERKNKQKKKIPVTNWQEW